MVRKVAFWGGASFFVALLIVSLFVEAIIPDAVKAPQTFLYEGRKLLGVAPFSPKVMPPLGSDGFGVSLWYLLLKGAKFTLLFMSIVAISRVVLAIPLAVMYAFSNRSLSFLKKGAETFYFLPTSLIVFFCFTALAQTSMATSNWMLFWQLLIFVIVGVIPLATFLGEELKVYMREEFIDYVKLTGVGQFYIFYKHLWLFIRPKMMHIFLDQVVQTLLLFAHIGVLGLFIGPVKLVGMDIGETMKVSATQEWAGLIGGGIYALFIRPWLLLAPLLAFTTVILVLKAMLWGIQPSKRQKIVLERQEEEKVSQVKKEHFQFVNHF